VLLLVVALLTIIIGVITCIVSGRGMGGRPGGPAEPATAPMLALQPGMDRLSHELSVQRDRHVRLQSVQNDLALDLPPSISLPDGEEIPYGSSTRLQIRDQEQESEIYQKCIRPPPNRTVFDGESPPPYRSSSAGVLATDWSTGSSSSAGSGSLVVRCHSISGGTSSKRPVDLFGRTVRCFSGKKQQQLQSSTTTNTTTTTNEEKVPSVYVPSRCRRLSNFTDSQHSNLSTLPVVQCHNNEQQGCSTKQVHWPLGRSTKCICTFTVSTIIKFYGLST